MAVMRVLTCGTRCKQTKRASSGTGRGRLSEPGSASLKVKRARKCGSAIVPRHVSTLLSGDRDGTGQLAAKSKGNVPSLQALERSQSLDIAYHHPPLQPR